MPGYDGGFIDDMSEAHSNEVRQLRERVSTLEKAIDWVLSDMNYKAPEQVNIALVQAYYNHLQRARKGA